MTSNNADNTKTENGAMGECQTLLKKIRAIHSINAEIAKRIQEKKVVLREFHYQVLQKPDLRQGLKIDIQCPIFLSSISIPISILLTFKLNKQYLNIQLH